MSDPEVFVGLDVGKAEHHCVALNVAGDRLVDRPLPNDEAALRELFSQLVSHGPVVMVVDQPASIRALPVAVAHDMGLATAYLHRDTPRSFGAGPHPTNRKAVVVPRAGPALEIPYLRPDQNSCWNVVDRRKLTTRSEVLLIR